MREATLILEAGDLIDWIADRDRLLVAAWTPELHANLSWEHPYAEAFASELHSLMITTMLGKGTEVDFLKMVARSNTGLKRASEKAVAERFYNVTLKLAQAASRRDRQSRTRAVFPYLRTTFVGDSRTNPGHLALAGIILHRDHSFWSRWHPPLDMDCRCGTIAMTKGQFDRHGEPVTGELELAEREKRLSGAWPPAFQPLLDFRA